MLCAARIMMGERWVNSDHYPVQLDIAWNGLIPVVAPPPKPMRHSKYLKSNDEKSKEMFLVKVEEEYIKRGFPKLSQQLSSLPVDSSRWAFTASKISRMAYEVYTHVDATLPYLKEGVTV